MRRQLQMVTLGFLVVAAIGAACTSAPAASTTAPATAAAQPAADVNGEALVKERCTGCHDLARVEAARMSETDWAKTVQHMVDKGARLTAEEQTAVVQYLSATYPK